MFGGCKTLKHGRKPKSEILQARRPIKFICLRPYVASTCPHSIPCTYLKISGVSTFAPPHMLCFFLSFHFTCSSSHTFTEGGPILAELSLSATTMTVTSLGGAAQHSSACNAGSTVLLHISLSSCLSATMLSGQTPLILCHAWMRPCLGAPWARWT